MENKERKEYSEALAVAIEKIREAIAKAAALRYVLDIDAAKGRRDAKTAEEDHKKTEAIDWESQNVGEAYQMTHEIQKLEDVAEFLQDMQRVGIYEAEAMEWEREEKRREKLQKENAGNQ